MTERQAIESTYFDKCSVFRRKNIKDDNTKIMSQQEVLIVGDISCALSQNKNSINTGQTSNTSNSLTLFTSPDIDVKKGDKIIVTCQSGQIYTCISAKPFIYSSHMEANLTEEEKA